MELSSSSSSIPLMRMRSTRPQQQQPVGFLLLLLLFTSLSSVTHAADWSSWFSSSSSSSSSEDDPDATKTNKDVLVSPILNRELQASVTAEHWPDSVHNVYCEGYALLLQQQEQQEQSDSLHAAQMYLDALTQGILQQQQQNATTTIPTTSYADATARVLEATSKLFLSASERRLLEYSLTLRAASPHCELYRTMAAAAAVNNSIDNSDAFAVVLLPKKQHNNKYQTTVVTASDVLESSMFDWKQLLREHDARGGSTNFVQEELLLPGEVVLGNSSNDDTTTTPLVVLYGNFGTLAFGQLYQSLRAASGGVPFVVRHLGASKSKSSVLLQGYGVRLDIRNVEYKVFDDRSDSTSSTTSDDTNDNNHGLLNVSDHDQNLKVPPEQFLAGVNVTALLLSSEDDDNEIVPELWKRHDRQYGHYAQIIPPVWQRRQLPLQAATVIASSASKKDPLYLLEHVSQNLPSVASTLVHVKVDPEIQAAAELLENSNTNNMLLRPGLLYMNGKVVADMDRPSFNMFESLLNQLRQEQAILRQMQRGGKFGSTALSAAALRDVQKAWISGRDFVSGINKNNDNDDGADDGQNAAYRVDVGRGWKQAIIYWNDVEKDAQYASWSTSLRQMMMNMRFGMPPSVRRNLFTVLAIVDPVTTAENNNGFRLGTQLLSSSYAARVGVLIVSEADVQACAKWLKSKKNLDDDTTTVVCPAPPIFPDDKKKPNSLADLSDIPASARAVHRLVSCFARDYSNQPGALAAYIEYLFTTIGETSSDGTMMSMLDLTQIHGDLIEGMRIASTSVGQEQAFQMLLEDDDDDDDSATAQFLYGKALRFAVDKGLKPGMSFLNGRPLPTDPEDDENTNAIFGEEQNHVFGMIMDGIITDHAPKSVYAKLLSGDRVFPKSHPLLTQEKSHVELQHQFADTDSLLFPGGSPPSSSADAYFVVDAFLAYDRLDGQTLASSLIDTLDSFPNSIGSSSTGDNNDDTTSIGLAYRILPSTQTASKSAFCPILAHASLVGVLALQKLFEAASLPVEGQSLENLLNSLGVAADVRERIISSSDDGGPCVDGGNPYLTQQQLSAENIIVANGREYQLDEDASIETGDVELLLSLELDRARAVTSLLRKHISFSNPSDRATVSRIAAFLAVEEGDSKGGRVNLEDSMKELESGLESKKNPLHFSWNSEMTEDTDDILQVQVIAVVDPVSEGAQRLSPLLRAIRDQLKLPLHLILTPATILEGDAKVPISSYYRFVADPKALADTMPPKATFSNLPTNHVLTLKLDVPEPWDVQQTYAVQDTDNLRCDIRTGCGDDSQKENSEQNTLPIHEQTHATTVEYGLKHLLIFGQCYEARGAPPNGLQLTLTRPSTTRQTATSEASAEIEMDGSISTELSAEEGTIADLPYSDTLVMKTVGYWQLQANPGVWKLSIAKESKGAEIFELVEGEVKNGRISVSNETASSVKTLVMKDFVNKGELLVVRRRPGFEKASLFHDDEEQVSSVADSDEEAIHVFSLATGHLYERFLKIMMLSVTKRTSTKVKFWLFENFLSPTFKSSARAMADRIGCEVEFVTYKWPEWLRGQSEKQRIIWGYKILFLDVLFPLNVKKIIYVDADQVVRGDLKELWDMDLKGAAYGYTPFCTSRETTLGYQFWRDGFWKNHLRDKPYHISALYVVDLDRFRRSRVGDQLRAIYQQLSADPNSLANLDQDLPNYAQHQVPIFSLPQEWLWCESWCSDETKATAKTIDLCNNPLHKEPKVSMAKRIISGDLFEESWVELDAEVERYEQEYHDTQQQQQQQQSVLSS